MLSGYQCEIIAFIGEGEIVCADCARDQYGELTCSKAERGLSNAYDLSPLIRYSVDESSGEQKYEYAEERVRDFERAHPVISAALIPDGVGYGNRAKLVDKLAEKCAGECCGACGEEID